MHIQSRVWIGQSRRCVCDAVSVFVQEVFGVFSSPLKKRKLNERNGESVWSISDFQWNTAGDIFSLQRQSRVSTKNNHIIVSWQFTSWLFQISHFSSLNAAKHWYYQHPAAYSKLPFINVFGHRPELLWLLILRRIRSLSVQFPKRLQSVMLSASRPKRCKWLGWLVDHPKCEKLCHYLKLMGQMWPVKMIQWTRSCTPRPVY